MKKRILISLTIAGLLFLLFGIVFPIAKRYLYHAVDIRTSRNYYYDWARREIHYVPLGNWFELGDGVLTEADVKTFRVISDQYAKDKSTVYYRGMKIDGADSETFEYLCAANEYRNGSRVQRGEFAKDKNRIYHDVNYFEDFNPSRFAFVGEECGSYLTDGKHVYSIFYDFHSSTKGFQSRPIPYLPDVDPDSFEVLDENYSRDNRRVFYRGTYVLGIEKGTFTILDYNYAKDASTVYCNGKPLADADSETFSLIEGGHYAKDNNAVYFFCNIVPGADSATFTMVSEGNKVNYARDKNRYYHGGHPE